MSGKKKVQGRVLSQQKIAPGIYDLWMETELAKEAGAGQFIGIYPEDGAHLLPRPISICEVDKARGALRVVYRIVGAGTAWFATWKPKQKVDILGVLGNGYPVREVLENYTGKENKKEEPGGREIVLLGGGIGIPPMLELAKELSAQGTEPVIVAGYRDQNLFLADDLAKYGRVLTATEDGSAGVKGNVLDVLSKEGIRPALIMACGPMPMLRAVKAFAAKEGVLAYISLEERMACGVGACLGCALPMKDGSIKHVCKDGPVFDAREVDWDA